jgi:hypothetical protein
MQRHGEYRTQKKGECLSTTQRKISVVDDEYALDSFKLRNDPRLLQHHSDNADYGADNHSDSVPRHGLYDSTSCTAMR